jgi:FkbM family methyltransferase
MSQDAYWSDVTEFLQKHLRSGEHLLAPPRFKTEFAHLPIQVSPYYASQGASLELFDWILLHKGMLGKLDRLFLQDAVARYPIVFANEVFVVLAKSATHLSDKTIDKAYLQPLWDAVGIAPSPRFPKLKKLLPSNATAQQLDLVLRRLASLAEQVKKVESKLDAKNSGVLQRSAIATLSREAFTQACRAACQTAYLGNDTLLCRVLGRYLLYAESQDVGIVPHLAMNGYWETWMTLAVARVIQPGWHCVDVGANHGYYTLLMADIVGDTGRVVALEPNPRLADLVKRTIIVNGFQERVTVLTDAVSETAGETLKLIIPKGLGMNASLIRRATDSDEVIEVQTTTLDQLTAAWGKVDFLKIDAEGAEELIWRGMAATLSNHPKITIVLEFNDGRSADPAAFLQQILEAGFPLRHIDFDAEIKDITVEQCLNDRPGQDWLLFLQR